MSRRAVLRAAGVALLVTLVSACRPRQRMTKRVLGQRPARRRPRPPDALYSNGLTPAEHHAALKHPCACADPRPWEYHHAPPVFTRPKGSRS